MSGTTIILLITATVTALIAGLFYAFSFSVNIGLSRLTDKGYLSAMQAINHAILNPFFFLSFFGTLLLLPLSAYLSYEQVPSSRFGFLIMATMVYVIGVFGVTVFGNVPLNEGLANFRIELASPEEIGRQREKFEHAWNRYHQIRMVASIICLILVLIAV
jgi:uncharacterized membrane protein